MSQQPPTALNPDEPLFDGHMPVDVLRRQNDRTMIERLDKDSARVSEISKRLGRLETTMEYTRELLDEIKKRQVEWLSAHEQSATAIVDIAQRLNLHASMEEVQWDVVNKSNARIEQLAAALSQHLEASGAITVRLDWIERLIYGVYGAAGSMIMLVGGWLLSKFGG